MIRTDMISTIGRPYLTSNIENDEFSYKKAFSHETAIQMIQNGECGAFNPLLIKCLVEIQDELKNYTQHLADKKCTCKF